MAEFDRPTPGEIIARIKGDIEGTVTGVSARLRRTVELAFAKSLGGVSHSLHGHLSWLARQIVPSSAMSSRFRKLWAAAFLADPLIEGSEPAGTILVTGSGGTVAAGTEFYREGDSAIYTADATTASITSESIAVTSAEVGTSYDLDTGATLTLVTPIANVDSAATVESPGIAGTDDESDDALLARLLLNLQTPPKGGGPGDHKAWVFEAGVGATRAWEYSYETHPTQVGIGERAVYFVIDDGDTVTAPSAGQITTVQGYIDDRTPLKATVAAPTLLEVTLTGTIAPNTIAVKAAAVAEFAALLRREAGPGEETVALSKANEAVSGAAGETDHTLTVPAADITNVFGTLAVPPSTWTDV